MSLNSRDENKVGKGGLALLKSMTFNHQRYDKIHLLRGRQKSPYHGIYRNIRRVGKSYRLKSSVREPIIIYQPIGFKAIEDVEQLEIVQSLTSWLITDDWAPLTFDDEPGRTYIALLQNNMDDFRKIATLREGTLQFIAIDTLGNSHDLTITTQFATHDITGQTSTPWKSRTVFTVPKSQFILESDKGLDIILNYNFIAGDVLEIDSDKREIRLNGDDLATALDIRSEWNKGEIEPGQVQLKASHETVLSYSERYY